MKASADCNAGLHKKNTVKLVTAGKTLHVFRGFAGKSSGGARAPNLVGFEVKVRSFSDGDLFEQNSFSSSFYLALPSHFFLQ